ncbi:hypothetical protein U9M48_040571, partial [Paspalum notatum var. saurae]
ALLKTQDAHRRVRDHEDERDYTEAPRAISSTPGFGETTDGDELDDDLTYDGRNDRGCCATLKYACGDGREDLLSAIYTLISVVKMLQSSWTLYRFGPIMYKCNNNRSFGCDID